MSARPDDVPRERDDRAERTDRADRDEPTERDDLPADVEAALRRAARAEAAADRALAPLDPLASPDLPDSDRARLDAAARAEPDGALLASLLRPVAPSAHARMVAAARAAMNEGERAGAEAAAEAEAREAKRGASSAEPLPFPGQPGARARPAPPSAPRSRRIAGALSALALAAGIALFVVTRPASPELPAYEASLAGGASTVRAPDAGARRVRAGGEVRVRLRPATAVPFAVGARAAIVQGHRFVPAEGTVEVLEGGALALTVKVPALPLVEPGDAELAVAVAAEGALPPALAPEDLAPAAGRRVLRLPIAIEAP